MSKELGKDHKIMELQSVNIDGKCTANQQNIADAFNKHFITIPHMINKTINANYCFTKTSENNQNKLFYI
jgi:hypothetical protein